MPRSADEELAAKRDVAVAPLVRDQDHTQIARRRTALLEVVPKAERVGLSPQEWIELTKSTAPCTYRECGAVRPATVEPPTAEEWRAAILSTVEEVN